MFKRATATVLGIVSLLGLNLPAQADDTIYPVDIQNYLIQLAQESDFLRVGNTIQHDHYIIEIPTETLVAMANTTCIQFGLGKQYQETKGKIMSDSIVNLPAAVKNKLGGVGMDKFTNGVVKSAVNNRCSQHKPKLPNN